MCDCELDEYAARLQADADAAYEEHAREEAASEERAAVVRWLRARAAINREARLGAWAGAYETAAERIEAGEHRKHRLMTEDDVIVRDLDARLQAAADKEPDHG